MLDFYTLMELVKAARLSEKLAETMQGTLLEKGTRTAADEISGFLGDVIVNISGEVQKPDEDYNDYRIVKELRGDASDGAVTAVLMKMWAKNQPKPNFSTNAESAESEENGYHHRPETKGSTGIKDTVKLYEKLNKITAMYKACEDENIRMRTILLQVAEEKCSNCWRKENGICGMIPCRWERFKKGDFS